MFEHVREYVVLEYRMSKPLDMDRNIHEIHQYRGNEGDTEITAKVMRDIRNLSPRRQLVAGVFGGFLSGFVITRTGKYACVFVGTSVIVLQLATQNDYIKFNLLRAFSYDDMRRPPGSNTDNHRRVRSMRPVLARFFQQLHEFLMDQPNLTSGLIGGFLIGLGFS